MNTNTIYISKISCSEFNMLEIDNITDHIIIHKLKYDVDIVIPVFIKSIHIKTLKCDDKKFNSIYVNKLNNKCSKIIIPSYTADIHTFNTFIELTKIPFDCKILFGGLTPDNQTYTH